MISSPVVNIKSEGGVATISEIIGQRVRAIRTVRGLSQGQLATASGLGPTHLSNLERGEQRWNLDHLFAVARALVIDPCDLLREGPADEHAALAELLAPDELELIAVKRRGGYAELIAAAARLMEAEHRKAGEGGPEK